MPRTHHLLILTVAAVGLAAACDQATEPPEPLVFQRPVAGEAYVDWYYGALPNHGEDWTIYEDFACGTKTRSFSHVTEFIMPSWSAIDEGVDVMAAADGEVFGLVDGQYDRWLTFNRGQVGNQIWIAHEGGFLSIYYNLKRGSLRVDRGDRVEAGDVIAQVGSSGYSNWPRVGFEARDRDGEPFDPWAGPCSGNRSYWTEQPVYPDSFVVVDERTIGAPPFLSIIIEDPPLETRFGRGYGVGFFVHVVNRPAGRLAIRIVGPDGVARDSGSAEFDRPRPANDFLGGAISLGDDAPYGTWAVEYTMNDEIFSRLEFDVVPELTDTTAGAAALTAPEATGTPASTELILEPDLGVRPTRRD